VNGNNKGAEFSPVEYTGNVKTRNTLLIVLALLPNILLASLVVFGYTETLPDWVFALWLAILVLMGLISLGCIVHASVRQRTLYWRMAADPTQGQEPLWPIVLAKWLLVPWFVLTFLAAALGGVALLIPHPVMLFMSLFVFGPLWAVSVVLLSLLNILLVLATSSYLVWAIITACRLRRVKLSVCIILCVLQILPVCDVLSCPFIVNYLRKLPSAPVLGVPVLGAPASSVSAPNTPALNAPNAPTPRLP
jgi:hypothetical protein